jgi:DNA-binding HxlR family transcriptional regulator
MNLPLPGTPVRGSTTGRPIMAALDILGRRGALRVIWELQEGGPLTFRSLQDACETNPGLLNTRLKELRAVKIVERAEGGYVLTSQGARLAKALAPLNRWAADWAEDLG